MENEFKNWNRIEEKDAQKLEGRQERPLLFPSPPYEWRERWEGLSWQ